MRFESPTPLTFARLMDALADPSGPGLGEVEVATLQRMLKRPKLFPRLTARLLSLAADAGLRRRAWDYLADAAESAEQLDRLLRERGWTDPEAVLDPEGRREVDFGQILSMLEARLARGEGDPEHLRLVQRRLVDVVETAEEDMETDQPDLALPCVGPWASRPEEPPKDSQLPQTPELLVGPWPQRTGS